MFSSLKTRTYIHRSFTEIVACVCVSLLCVCSIILPVTWKLDGCVLRLPFFSDHHLIQEPTTASATTVVANPNSPDLSQ